MGIVGFVGKTWEDRSLQTSLIIDFETKKMSDAIKKGNMNSIQSHLNKITRRLYEDVTWVNDSFGVNGSIDVVTEDMNKIIPMLIVLKNHYQSINRIILFEEIIKKKRNFSELVLNKMKKLSKNQENLKLKILHEMHGINRTFERVLGVLSNDTGNSSFQHLQLIKNQLYSLKNEVSADTYPILFLNRGKNADFVERVLISRSASISLYEDSAKLIRIVSTIIDNINKELDKSYSRRNKKRVCVENSVYEEATEIADLLKCKIKDLNLLNESIQSWLIAEQNK